LAAINWTEVVNPNYLYLLPELTLVATMLIVMIADFYVSEKRYLVWFSVAGLALAMILTWFTATDSSIFNPNGAPKEFFGNMVVADGFSFFMRAVLLGIAALVTLMSTDFVEKYLKGMFMEFFEVMFAATLGMMLMVGSRDFLAIYVGLELASISSYVLAGLLRKDAKSNEAALKYFLNGAFASAVLLFGFSLIYGASGETNLVHIVDALRAGATHPGMLSLMTVGMIFMAGGFAFKISAVPMHLWAPDAYEGAPTPIAGFFSVGPKGAAFGAILRIFMIGLGVSPLTGKWTIIWAVLATASMFVGNITALMQTSIKRMMAYSSIAQAGYLLVGVVAAGSNMTSGKGIGAVLFYVMGYALTNLGIFAVLTHLDQEGEGTTLENMKGLFHRNPFYAVTLFVCFLSLIGIPPTVGFFGKLFIFNAAVEANYIWLALVMAVNSVISVGYYYGVIKAMFLEKSDKQALSTSTGVMITVAVSFIGVMLAGILSGKVIEYTEMAARMLR
jgi:NADH-quinone oxidoreductase subunit N